MIENKINLSKINNFDSIENKTIEQKDLATPSFNAQMRNSIFSESLDIFKYKYKSETEFAESNFINSKSSIATPSVSNQKTSGFYLTGIDLKQTLSKIDNKDKENKDIKTERKRDNFQKEKILKYTTKEFINFILNEHTEYADIELIENEYLLQNKIKHEALNSIEEKVTKAKERIKLLDLKTEQEIIKTKQTDKQALIKQFNNKIINEKKNIAEAFYNYNSNLKILNRSKTEGYSLREQFKEALKESKLIDEQYKKYLMLKNSTFSLLNSEIKTFNELKEFDKLCSYDYLTNLQSRKEHFNELDFKLYLARSLTIEGEKVLENIKSNQAVIRSSINKITKENQYKVSFMNISLNSDSNFLCSASSLNFFIKSGLFSILIILSLNLSFKPKSIF